MFLGSDPSRVEWMKDRPEYRRVGATGGGRLSEVDDLALRPHATFKIRSYND
jgi:hypothetical protein